MVAFYAALQSLVPGAPAMCAAAVSMLNARSVLPFYAALQSPCRGDYVASELLQTSSISTYHCCVHCAVLKHPANLILLLQIGTALCAFPNREAQGVPKQLKLNNNRSKTIQRTPLIFSRDLRKRCDTLITRCLPLIAMIVTDGTVPKERDMVSPSEETRVHVHHEGGKITHKPTNQHGMSPSPAGRSHVSACRYDTRYTVSVSDTDPTVRAGRRL